MSPCSLRLVFSMPALCGLAAGAVLGAAGCAAADSDTVAFEISYVNTNTTPAQYKGYYVTRGGDLYQYDFRAGKSTDDPPPERPETLSDAEIREAYGSSPRKIATVSGGDVRDWFERASGMSGEALVVQESHLCNEPGEYTYRAFRDVGNGQYGTIVLGRVGYHPAAITGPDSQGMLNWLIQTSRSSINNCTFDFEAACDSSSCTAEASWCVAGTNGKDWVDSTHCAQVSDCKACKEGACVIDAAGGKHCTWAEDCSDNKRICASGADWCRGEAFSGISCVEPAKE